MSYEITKKVDSNVAVEVVVTVTSSPIPGVQPISVTSRVNSVDVEFDVNTQVVRVHVHKKRARSSIAMRADSLKHESYLIYKDLQLE